MRDDVLMTLTDRVLTDADFRTRLRANLDDALRDDGFVLDDEELAAVREFHISAVGLTDAELAGALTNGSHRQQST